MLKKSTVSTEVAHTSHLTVDQVIRRRQPASVMNSANKWYAMVAIVESIFFLLLIVNSVFFFLLIVYIIVDFSFLQTFFYSSFFQIVTKKISLIIALLHTAAPRPP